MKEFPLQGFFISIKESLRYKGTASTGGFYINLGNKCSKHSKTVKTLIKKGAIITCKGNVPQGLFSMESYNNVFGESKNPYDIWRTPGGSSGGDSGLVRLGLVNAAIGSDIAGSLRIPALFCGIVTLKPSALRLSMATITAFFEFHPIYNRHGPSFNSFLLPTIGPLTRCVEDCEKIMECLVNEEEGDIFTPPLKWWKNIKLPKRIGVLK